MKYMMGHLIIPLFFSCGSTALVGLDLLYEVAETSPWQHTTPTSDRHPCSGGIRTRNQSKRAAADPRLRPRGHWYRHTLCNLALFLL